MCCWKAHCLTSFNSIRLPYENSQRPKAFIQKNSIQRDHLFWWKCSLWNPLRERRSAKCQPESSGSSRTKPEGKWHAVHILLCLLSVPTSLSFEFFIWKFYRDPLSLKFYPAWNFSNIPVKTGAMHCSIPTFFHSLKHFESNWFPLPRPGSIWIISDSKFNDVSILEGFWIQWSLLNGTPKSHVFSIADSPMKNGDMNKFLTNP